jgi:heme exporter protein C
MKRAFPILGVLTAILLSYALYQALVVAPTERTMGDVQRIFYYHVPSAWTAFILFFINFIASVTYLIWRKPAADIVALVSAEVGVVFCTIVLVTGPIWARPVWGVWWTVEVRLTSTLILWLIFVGYLLLRDTAENREQAARWGAVVAIVGALDVPIIYKSVEWWRGLHPKVLKISGGGGLEPTMQRALLLCSVTFTLLFAHLLIQRCRLGLLQDEVERLAHAGAREPARAAGGPGPKESDR